MSKTTVVTLRLNTELQQTIQAMAQAEEIPASYIIRRLIKTGLKAENKLPATIKKTEISVEDWQ